MKDLDTSSAKVAFDLALQSAPDILFDQLVSTYLRHEHALDGVVIATEDLQRAISGRPVRTRLEAEVYQSIRNMRANFQLMFLLIYPELDLERSKYACDEAQLLSLAEDLSGTINAESRSPVSRQLCESFYRVQGSKRADMSDVYKCEVVHRQRSTSPGVYHLSIIDIDEVDGAMDDLFRSYREDCSRLHPIECAAEFHWRYMQIFPYDDTTSYVGRLLLQTHLIWSHLPPAMIYQTDRHNYFNGLNSSPEELLEVIYNGVQASEQICRKVLGLA